MTRHAAYWQPLIDSGQMVIFGPVLDGTGSWTFAPQHSATAAALSICPGQISPARTSRPGHLTEGEPAPGQPARRVPLEASVSGPTSRRQTSAAPAWWPRAGDVGQWRQCRLRARLDRPLAACIECDDRQHVGIRERAQLRPLLLELTEERESFDLLFAKWDGSTHTRAWFLAAVKRVCKAAGVPRVCPHGLRGTHATIALEVGVARGSWLMRSGTRAPARCCGTTQVLAPQRSASRRGL